MNLPISLRNLARNRWRTALTLGGIALGVAVLIWTRGMMQGLRNQMLSSTTGAELGHVQLQRSDYAKRPSLWKAFRLSQGALAQLDSVPDVAGVAPRLVVWGLVGHERRSRVARIVGVDPLREARTSRVASSLVEGHWLPSAAPSDEPPAGPVPAVLGAQFAHWLGVSVGDELVVMLQAADGSLGNDRLEVVGTVRVGQNLIDRQTVFVPLPDAQRLAALDGKVHLVALRARSFDRVASVVEAVRRRIGAWQGPALTARPWWDLVPDMYRVFELWRVGMWILYAVIYAVVALGIVNTLRMGALERRREFGVLLAIGMLPTQVGRMLLAEAAWTGLLGGLLGAVLGGAVTWYHARFGFSLGAFSGANKGFSYMGVSIPDRVHFVLDALVVTPPLVIIVLTAALAGLWPAVAAARIDAPCAISGR